MRAVSGGAWGYRRDELEEAGNRAESAFSLLAEIEHCLDWGISGDTCFECAKVQAIAALCLWFGRGDRGSWWAVFREEAHQYLCPRCFERYQPQLLVPAPWYRPEYYDRPQSPTP